MIRRKMFSSSLTYKEFKKTVIEYFKPHSAMKNVKKQLRFNEIIEGIYDVEFTYDNKKMTLNYVNTHWTLTSNDKIFQPNTNCDYDIVLNISRTINECCDYLWKEN